MTMQAYHWLRDDRTAGNGNEPAWKDGETRTLPKGTPIAMCERGYHASPTPWEALAYAPGGLLCLVELGEDAATADGHADKLVSRSRTLIRSVDVTRELRLFAADCAEEVLYLFERERPNDDRPRKAIEAARAFARGEISAAARAAARAAAWAAAWAAARDAARAAARDAARAAAWDAAWAAARDAARAAAWAAARAAAWDAARDAAWAAARAAQSSRFNAMCYGLLGVEVAS